MNIQLEPLVKECQDMLSKEMYSIDDIELIDVVFTVVERATDNLNVWNKEYEQYLIREKLYCIFT